MEKYIFGFVFVCLVVAIISIGLGTVLDALHTRKVSGRLRVNPVLCSVLLIFIVVCCSVARKVSPTDHPVWGEMTLAGFLLWLIAVLIFLNIHHVKK